MKKPDGSIDWTRTEDYAKTLTVTELLYAIRDAQETIRLFEAGGLKHEAEYYYDEISVLRQELNKRRTKK